MDSETFAKNIELILKGLVVLVARHEIVFIFNKVGSFSVKLKMSVVVQVELTPHSIFDSIVSTVLFENVVCKLIWFALIDIETDGLELTAIHANWYVLPYTKLTIWFGRINELPMLRYTIGDSRNNTWNYLTTVFIRVIRHVRIVFWDRLFAWYENIIKYIQ